jgi:chloride channel 7
MTGQVENGEGISLLKRTATFKAPPQRTYDPSASLLSKVLGTKNAANNRVSESLDYEPIQNKIYYERLKAKKEGKKKIWG